MWEEGHGRGDGDSTAYCNLGAKDECVSRSPLPTLKTAQHTCAL